MLTVPVTRGGGEEQVPGGCLYDGQKGVVVQGKRQVLLFSSNRSWTHSLHMISNGVQSNGLVITNLSMFRESSRTDCKGEGRSGQQGVFRLESRSIDKSSEHRNDKLRGGLYRSSRHHWRAREVHLHRLCQQSLMMTGMEHVRTFLTPSRGKSLRGSRRRPWPRLLRGRLERCKGGKTVSLDH